MRRFFKSRSLSMVLAAAMLVCSVPETSYAAAEQNELQETEIFSETAEESAEFSAGTDSNTLLEEYLVSKIPSEEAVLFAAASDYELNETETALYNYLKGKIVKIAAGESSSTSITIPDSIYYETWSYSELGVAAPSTDYTEVCTAAKTKMYETFSFQKVIRSLFTSMPYEFYWSKQSRASFSYSYEIYSSKIGIHNLAFKFDVSDVYGSSYTIDTTKTQRAATAAANVGNIVAAAIGKSDYEKLVYYKEQICSLVSYDYEAAESYGLDSDGNYDGDPWQLVSVFDGDDSTNVVCEGYAKAFQFLCDQSSFASSKVICYEATGYMAAGGSGGGHMWNIMVMNDGKSYLVDVTNSDEGCIGQDGGLFLAGTAGSVAGGYTFSISGQNSVSYIYDSDMTLIYSEDKLTLASSDYDPTAVIVCEHENTERQGAVAATCGSDGYTGDLVCSDCGEVLETGSVIAAIGEHSWDEGEITKEPDADGVGKITYTCTVCGAEKKDNYYGTVVEYGSAGDSAEYYLNDQGILYIVGEGLVFDYTLNVGDVVNSPDHPDAVTKAEKVCIDEGITEIGDRAFYGCSTLEYVHFASTITDIDDYAFCKCTALQNFTLPENLLRIQECAFEDCDSITEIRVPGSLIRLGGDFCCSCDSLESAYFEVSETVTSYSVSRSNPFSVCKNLKFIEVESGHPAMYTSDGVLYFNGGYLACYPCRKEGDTFEIPETVNNILIGAFYSANNDRNMLKNLVVPGKTITYDGSNLGYWPSLERVEFRSGALLVSKYTSDSPFETCANLKYMDFDGDYSEETGDMLSLYIQKKAEWTASNYLPKNKNPLVIHYPEGNTTWTEEVIAALKADNVYLEPWDPETGEYRHTHIFGDWITEKDSESETGAAEYRICSICGCREEKDYLTLTSMDTDGNTSIAALIGGGRFEEGSMLTVSAPAKEGYTFLGWYKAEVNDSGEVTGYDENSRCSCTLDYSFALEEDTRLVAVYEANGDATLQISGAYYTVNDGSEQMADSKNVFRVGTSITVKYTGSDGFCYWKNASNKIVSTNASCTFTLTQNMSLTPVYVAENSGAAVYSAFVEFRSMYGQVMSASVWYSDETAADHSDFPAGPTLTGKQFIGWSMDGSVATTAKDILAAISASNSHIILTPLYEVEDSEMTYTITVIYPDGTQDVYKDNTVGNIATIQAKAIESKTFKCWSDKAEGGAILSYNEAYFVNVSQDVTLYALYTDAETAVEIQPAIAMTAMAAKEDAGVKKLYFSATRDVSGGYTVVSQGILYTTTEMDEASLVIGAAGIHQGTGNDRNLRGVYSIYITVGDKTDTTVYARGYMTLKNGLTGNIEVYYTDIVSTSYNGLTEAK